MVFSLDVYYVVFDSGEVAREVGFGKYFRVSFVDL